MKTFSQKRITKASLISIFLSFSLFQSYGQSFVNINAPLTGLSNSYAAWGDYDNDKDLDLLISGEASDYSLHIKLYRNNNGQFEEVPANFTGIKNGSVKWGDYDNDADLDILATGTNDDGRAFIYKNEGNEFVDINMGFAYFGPYSHACWGDYDNDGDLDIFITGGWNSKLYRNDGQDIFTDTGLSFSGLSSSRACWGDYDKDGDMDILLTGDTGGGMKLFCYINSDGQFEEIEFANMGLSAGSVEWGDYDSDGDLDILIMGFNDYVEPEANIYRNDGNHVFTNIYAGLPPVALGTAVWGDADNDGDLDVALTGKLAGCGATASAIYENQGNGIFNDITTFLTNADRSTVSWGDFDNDSDLDLLLTGKDYNGYSFSKIYRNDFSLPNLLPDAPTNLNMELNGDVVVLSWDHATDPQTNQNSLSYNIRIGTAPQQNTVLSPMAFLDDGYRKLPDFGNTGNANYYKVKNLEPGITYYWSVQTIDNTFAASPFSEEHSFYLTYTSTVEKQMNLENIGIYPNPAHDFIRIRSDRQDEQAYFLSVTSTVGDRVIEKTITINEELDISFLKKGFYIIKIVGETKSFTSKFYKN
jgi:hypothetical protein